MVRILVVLSLSCLLLAACGGDDDNTGGSSVNTALSKVAGDLQKKAESDAKDNDAAVAGCAWLTDGSYTINGTPTAGDDMVGNAAVALLNLPGKWALGTVGNLDTQQKTQFGTVYNKDMAHGDKFTRVDGDDWICVKNF